VSDLENLDPTLKRQYTGAYGEFQAGDYSIGDTIKAPGIAGEVIWSYRSAKKGLVYVVDDNSGFPVEIAANEVRG